MKFSSKNYARALYEAISESPKDVPKIAKNFYFYLLKNRQLKILPFILQKLDEVAKEREKIISLEVETTHPLDGKLKCQMSREFDQRVVIKEKINPGLLGGVVLKWGENIFDASILGTLKKLRRVNE